MRPSTNNTPQSMRDASPVVRNETMLADGVVMPRPELRPVAFDTSAIQEPISP